MDSAELEPKNWLRCNSCFVSMRTSKVTFSLSICSHIFCSKCLPKVTKKCPQCNTQNIRFVPLTEPLNPEIKHCFESTEKLAEQFKQATRFQNMQLSINSNHFRNLMDKKYPRVKTEYQRLSENFKRLKNRIVELESQLESANRNLYEIQNSSVRMTPHSNVSSLKLNPRNFSSRGFISRNGDTLQRPQSGYKTYITQSKPHQDVNFNSEFRTPTMTRVPRSMEGSSRSSNSQFSNFTPFNCKK